MTPEATLIELLERAAATTDGTALVSVAELDRWEEDAASALKAQKLISKAPPTSSAICPGCERECVMPVHTIPATAGTSAHFIICDKRSDINRVPIAPAQLEQWTMHMRSVAQFVAQALSLRFSGKRPNNDLLEIGVAAGERRFQMLCLRCGEELNLVAGLNSLPVSEAIRFHNGRYELSTELIVQLVDSSDTPDSNYTSSTARQEVRKAETEAMRAAWRKEYRSLKKRRPKMSDVWCSQQIAKMEIGEGKQPETIRRQMTK